MTNSNQYQTAAEAAHHILTDAIDTKGMTKNEVARITGLTPTTIIRIYQGESGRLHPRTVTQISQALGYVAEFGGDDMVKIKQRTRSSQGVLTHRQKEKILRTVTDALRAALADL